MKGVQMANEDSAADAGFRSSVLRDLRPDPADFFRWPALRDASPARLSNNKRRDEDTP